MNSAAIMALIQKKEKELKKLETNKKSVDVVYDTMDCVASKYAKAGELIKSAGDIGGVPFERGKTSESALELQNITAEVEGVSVDLVARIATLKAEIQVLYVKYRNALEAERIIAAEAAARQRKRYTK